ncbi:ribosomal protein S6 kinase alpha-5-like isoform X2 [Varroa destructor]|uniref:non-specific serine/threonine protein kinase n=1 Tax=Varroa destructor TaxID=109461 RepID=A0A7M7MCT2_VARDE|nr:ribosomal protein S6 kinase alpha-5-like isoform X2 [Varroa destructor]
MRVEAQWIQQYGTTVNLPEQHGGHVNMTNFELLRVLGTGAYGKVFLVRKIAGHDNGKLYAMKVLKKASIVQKQKTLEHTKTERQVLEAIRQSPFLVNLHYAFQTKTKLHLILDFISGGELFTHLYQRDHFEEAHVKFYIGEIIVALEQLHKLGIIYRDIKLENILLDAEGHIVLTDFGLSKEFVCDNSSEQQRTFSFCGTIEYMAPEVVKASTTGHDYCADWWSVGVLTYELLTGASPFTVEGEKNNQAEISKRILRNQPPMPSTISSEARDFIEKLLIKDPTKRLGGGSGGAEELKAHRFFRGINWIALANKQISAPFVPKITNELDVSNFSEEFTSMIPADSPAVVPNYSESDTGDLFKGYSYVAPSVLFSANALSKDLMISEAQGDARPGLNQLIAARFKNSTFFRDYDLLVEESGFLGDGSFSVCRKCVHKETGIQRAVKIVSRRLDTSREVQLLRMCQGHSNIVELVQVYDDEYHTYIVTELLSGGELFQMISRKSSFTENEARKIFKRLVSAVNFMHKRSIVHRDLKPENLLFTADKSTIKVVDFGFARLKPAEELMKTPCFTVSYAAPEVLNQAQDKTAQGYNEQCDLWSLGVILYAMLSGRSPFHSPSRDASAAAIMKRITAGDFTINSSQWDVVSADAKQIVQGLLTVDPQQRLTMSELRAHSWLHHPNKKNLRTPLATPEVLHSDQRQHLMGTQKASMAASKTGTPDVLAATSNSADALASAGTSGFRATFDAFHLATRGGFRLAEVGSASLAQRRLQKKSAGSRSTSTSTSSSSCVSGSASSRPSNASPSTRHVSSSSSGMPPSCSSASSAPSVFTFPETKVAAYLQTLSPSASPEPAGPPRYEPEPIQSPGSDSSSSNALIKAEFTVIQTEPLKFKFELLNGNGSSEPLEGLAVAATSTKMLSLGGEHKMITRRRKKKADEELFQAKRLKV